MFRAVFNVDSLQNSRTLLHYAFLLALKRSTQRFSVRSFFDCIVAVKQLKLYNAIQRLLSAPVVLKNSFITLPPACVCAMRMPVWNE